MKIHTMAFAATTCVLGCNNTAEGIKADAVQALSTTVHHARAAGDELKDEFRGAKGAIDNDVTVFTTKTDRQLDELAAKIERLRREAVTAPESAKQQLNEQATALEQRKDALAAKAETLGDQASAGWENTKAELSAAVANLGRDIDHALDELGNDVRKATD